MPIMTLDIHQGIGRIVELGRTKPIKPVLVAVHAPGAHHGKTYFINRACRSLSAHGYDVWSTNDFDHPDGYAPYLMNDRDYYFFHIGMKGPRPDVVNDYTRRYLGRDADIHVLVYNPRMVPRPMIRKGVDIVIENPGSTRKGKL